MSYDIWKVPRNEPQAQVRNAVTRSGTFPSKFIAYQAQLTPRNSVNKH